MFLHSRTSRCNIMISIHLPLSPFPQGYTNVTEVARCNENFAPYVVVIGNLQEPSQMFIVVDQQIVTEVNIIYSPFALLSAIFVFNIHYPKGCTNGSLYIWLFFVKSITYCVAGLGMSYCFCTHYHYCTLILFSASIMVHVHVKSATHTKL